MTVLTRAEIIREDGRTRDGVLLRFDESLASESRSLLVLAASAIR